MSFIFLVLFSFSALAQTPYYLAADSIDLQNFPIPPRHDSAEDLADLAHVLAWQTQRTPEDCQRATVEAAGYATSFFAPPYGPLTDEEAAVLVEMQERLFAETKFFSRQLKEQWQRLRPHQRSDLVQPCIPLHASSSYPSGHAAVAILAGRAFAMIYPERAQRLFERAIQIGDDRVIGGVHYPLDVIRGRELGEKIFEALKQNERFLRDVQALAEQK
mgnify:CR=1 FL=1